MTNLTPTDSQRNALKQILTWLVQGECKYLSIGGYAGTGKTTLIALLRTTLTDLDGPIQSVAFCSYTGKAASVMRQKLHERKTIKDGDSCGTIHSLIYTAETDSLGDILGWKRVSSLTADLIVVDEGSMVNETIWTDLLGFKKPILVFGDHGQLPPIEGTFNLMEKPNIVLDQIVRQAEGNPLIRLSRAVRLGKAIPYGTFYGAVRKFPAHTDEARDLFEDLVRHDDPETLVICGTNRTRLHLNRQIRALRGFEEEMPRAGERVICLRNNHAKALYNGMLGTITKIKEDGEHWYDVRIDFGDSQGAYHGSILKYQFGQAKTLQGDAARALPLAERDFGDLFDFGYAMTTHKSQGSEARQVILFEERMPRYDDEMWNRWLYTAVTRAREELVIFA